MLKTGIVIKRNLKSATIMTSEGDILKVKPKSKICPQVGEIYTEKKYKKNRFVISLLLFAVLFSILIYSVICYSNQFTSRFSIILEANASVQLNINKLNAVSSYSTLNSNGASIIENIDLKGRNFDLVLTEILDKADKAGLLANFKSKKDKNITIFITEHNGLTVDLKALRNKAVDLKINLLINDNGLYMK